VRGRAGFACRLDDHRKQPHLKTGQAFVAEADELDVAHAVNAGARLDRLPDRIVSLSATHPHGGPVRLTSLVLTIWAGRPYYPFDAGSAGA
jgi:hypothetical protein